MKFYKFLMLALISVLLVACTEESDDTVSEPEKVDVNEDSTEKDAKFTYSEGKIGERIIYDDRVAVTITDIEFTTEIPEDVVLASLSDSLKEGTKLAMVTALQEVVSKETQLISDDTVKLIDSEGFEYVSTSGGKYWSEEDGFTPGILASPKIPYKTKTIFVVPTDFDENDYSIHFYEFKSNIKTIITK